MTRNHTPALSKRQLANRENAKKPRVGKRLRRALELMVYEGEPRAVAAKRAGMSDSGLYQALRRPHVRALMNQAFNDLKDGETFRAYFRQVALAEGANSEDTRYKANAWIAGCGGLAPVSKVAVQGQVTHSFEGIGFAPPPETVDAEAEEAVVVDASEPEPGEVDPADVVLVDDGEEGG